MSRHPCARRQATRRRERRHRPPGRTSISAPRIHRVRCSRRSERPPATASVLGTAVRRVGGVRLLRTNAESLHRRRAPRWQSRHRDGWRLVQRATRGGRICDRDGVFGCASVVELPAGFVEGNGESRRTWSLLREGERKYRRATPTPSIPARTLAESTHLVLHNPRFSRQFRRVRHDLRVTG